MAAPTTSIARNRRVTGGSVEMYSYLSEDAQGYTVRDLGGSTSSIARIGTLPGAGVSTRNEPELLLLMLAHLNWFGLLAAGIPTLVITPVLLAWGLVARRNVKRSSLSDRARRERVIDLALVELGAAWLISQVVAGLLLLNV